MTSFAAARALAALLLLSAADAPPDPYAPGRAIVADIQKLVGANAIDETFTGTLGGAKQVVNARGADRANPILLYVHGGPASVEMPIAWSFQRPWEDYFTVVQWDQRGAGRSYRLESEAALAPTLSPERYRDDAIELIELLRRKYGKRRIILLGHSWGSVVGMMVAAKRPDLLHAYVGVGQMINFRENERVGYAWTLAEAKRRNDAAAVKALEGIAPYPGTGPLDVAKTGVEREINVRYGGLAWRRDSGDFYFHTARLSPLYTTADRQAWDAGSAFTMRVMWPKLADIDFFPLKRIDVPVVFFVGRHDTTTPSEIAERWLKAVKAPSKRIVWFENFAHLPIVEEPGRTLRALVDQVRPLARE